MLQVSFNRTHADREVAGYFGISLARDHHLCHNEAHLQNFGCRVTVPAAIPLGKTPDLET